MFRSVLTLILPALAVAAATAAPPRSHPPLRDVPTPEGRPAATGPTYYVDAGKGDDGNAGTREAPWRTMTHAFRHLKAGDTLYLRGGTYYENVYLAVAGQAGAPITIRSAPGEQAVIDGGIREFFETPADCWEPSPQGAEGEYLSKRAYPNLRTIVGSFGDSMVGLQTYYHAQDLRATNELVDWEDWNRQAETDIKPLYCGPGLWYDAASGRLHLRLAHTHLPDPVPNYRGPTDPRELPLVLAPFHAVPLHLDGARHVRFQDLTVRGAGYTAVRLDQAADVEFDNVTVWCGTYGLQVAGTERLRLVGCGLYGNVAPWTFRSDGSKRDYPGRPHRNLSRLNTHALLELGYGLESSVYATPQNDRWEIAHCDFADAHDGLYLGAINVRFHHNLVENLQDDGLYLSQMYHRHRLEKTDPEVHVYQNVFRQLLTGVAFGGPEPETRDQIFLYRNVFDLRGRVPTGRPTARRPQPTYSTGHVMGDHGSPPWPAMNIYHNTFVIAEPARQADMATLGSLKAGHPRRVFNNIFLHLARLPAFPLPDPAADVVEDGNLYWAPGAADKVTASFFQRFRASEAFARSKRLYPPGSTSHSRAADPRFRQVQADPAAANDYRLDEGSPAVDAGAELPGAWPDPLREQDKGKPDVGALPLGSEPLRVGRKSAPEGSGAGP